jgi:predicted RNA-binding Zn-ribbon protein involved in translation (DUF1610 family)
MPFVKVVRNLRWGFHSKLSSIPCPTCGNPMCVVNRETHHYYVCWTCLETYEWRNE